MPPEDSPAEIAAWLVAAIRATVLPLLPPPPLGAGLAEAATAEGLAGIAAELLPAGWPGRSALLRQRQRQFAFAARLAAIENELGAALAAAGCQALLLKGAALLQGPYRSAWGRRPLSDLDLLIRPSEAPAVATALIGLGLRPLDPTRWRGDGFEIDLHHDLLGMAGQGLAGRSPFRIDDEDLFDRSLPADPGGPALRLPASEDLFLHLALHGQKHAFCRLVWLLDLALLLPRVDAGLLRARAGEWNAERALAAALALLWDPLGLELPAELVGADAKLGAFERAWLERIRRRPPGRPAGLGRVIAGLAIPGPGDRLAYWLKLVWPGREALGRLGAGRHLARKVLPRLGEAFSLWLPFR